MIKRRSTFPFIAILIIGFIGGLTSAAVAIPQYIASSSTAPVTSGASSASVTNVVEKTLPSVVSISSTKGDERTFGTGFIVSSDGVIVTCAHVVKDTGTDYQITTQDNKTFSVKVLSRHKNEDIAFLKVDAASGLPVLKLGNSDTLKPGQQIVAIGNPFGILDGTVSQGIVSGIHRDIIAMDQSNSYQEGLNDLIQIDASLNPGESGGPLLDMAGNVIGINAASDTRAQNISFAIPSNEIRRIGILDGMEGALGGK